MTGVEDMILRGNLKLRAWEVDEMDRIYAVVRSNPGITTHRLTRLYRFGHASLLVAVLIHDRRVVRNEDGGLEVVA